MKNAEGKVFENISEETIRKAKVDNDAVVESWTTVCELMEKDSIQEVSQLKELIKRARGNHNEISWGARRIKIYPLIRDRYLPRLRRVEYFYEYSELRTLNKDEIDALYKKIPKTDSQRVLELYHESERCYGRKTGSTLQRGSLDTSRFNDRSQQPGIALNKTKSCRYHSPETFYHTRCSLSHTCQPNCSLSAKARLQKGESFCRTPA